jgi:hypothetical protein
MSDPEVVTVRQPAALELVSGGGVILRNPAPTLSPARAPLALWRLLRTSMLLLGGVLVSCTHVKARDETVEEHRNDAAIHLEKAREQEAQYDPAKTIRPPPRGPGSQMFEQVDVPFEPYNPGDEHMQAADRELVEANAHLVAAKSLEKFEDKACTGLSAGERASCPLFASSVSRVEWLQDGFKLTFKEGAGAGKTYARLRCHLAFAYSNGFVQPSCPLFIKGTTLKQSGDDAITFTAETAEVAGALRVQARRIFPASKTPTTVSAH